MIKLEGFSKHYGSIVAVNDVSFEVSKGEVVGFLGPNCAGKTTTMRALTGYLPPTRGRIEIAGFDPDRYPLEAKRATGYLPESPPLYPEMRVREYVKYVAALHDVPRVERASKVDKALAACGLEAVAARVIGTL